MTIPWADRFVSVKQNPRLWMLVWLSLLGVALVLRLANLDFGLPQRLHPDEWSQVDVAWRMANGDWNPHFFRYPAGHMALLAGIYRLSSFFYEPKLSDLYLTGRWVSVLLGVLGVGLAVLWGTRLWGSQWAGLMAGLLATFNWTLIEQSHYAIVDVPLMFWSGLTLFALSETRGRDGWLVLSSVSLGFAIASKYTAFLLLVPYFLVNWLGIAPKPSLSVKARSSWLGLLGVSGLASLGTSLFFSLWRNEILQWAGGLTSDGHLESEYLRLYSQITLLLFLAGLLLLVLGVALWRLPNWQGWNRLLQPEIYLFLLLALGIFVILSPFTLIEWQQSAQSFFYEFRHMQIGSAAHYPEDSLLFGQFRNDTGVPSLMGYATLFLSEWGWLGFALAGLGSLKLVRMKPGFGIALLVYLIFYGWMISGWANYAARYAILFSLPLAVLAGGSLSFCQRWLVCTLPRWSVPGTLLLFLLALWTPIQSTLSALSVFRLPDTRQVVYAWVLENIPADAYLAYDSYTPDFLAEPLPFRLLGTSSFVLHEYRSRELREAGVDYVITTFDPQNTSLASFVSPEAWQEFTSDYDLIKVFTAQPGQSRGHTIWVYQARQPR